MLKQALFAAALILVAGSARTDDAALIFRGPGNTQIYADVNCTERAPSKQYEINQPNRIECSIDGNKTTMLIAVLPERTDRNWFRHEDIHQIIRILSVGTELQGHENALKFQGSKSIPGAPFSYFETSGIECKSDLPCKLDGRKAQLIVIGHEGQSVGLLVIGDGYVDEIRAVRNGKVFVAASQRRFPRAIEAMISSFNFNIFRLQPDLLRAVVCGEQLQCIAPE